MVQWSGLHTFHFQGLGSIPGWGTKILQATQCGQKKKDKELLLQTFKTSLSFSPTHTIQNCQEAFNFIGSFLKKNILFTQQNQAFLEVSNSKNITKNGILIQW